jgi:hypothetical protein
LSYNREVDKKEECRMKNAKEEEICTYFVLDQTGHPVCMHNPDFPSECSLFVCPVLKELIEHDTKTA